MLSISRPPRAVKSATVKTLAKSVAGDPIARYAEALTAVTESRRDNTAARRSPDRDRVAETDTAFGRAEESLDAARHDLALALESVVRAAIKCRDPLVNAILHRLRDVSLGEVLA